MPFAHRTKSPAATAQETSSRQIEALNCAVYALSQLLLCSRKSFFKIDMELFYHNRATLTRPTCMKHWMERERETEDG